MRPALPFLLLASLALARNLTGCTAAQGRAIEAAFLQLGEAACEAFLPMTAPGLGSMDALVCKGAESAVTFALGAAGVGKPASTSILGGGGAAEPGPLPYLPLRRADGRVVALVRVGAVEHRAAQALLGKPPPPGSVPRANADAGAGPVVLGDGGP